MAKQKRTIRVVINFSEDDVQSFLDAANFGEQDARQLKDLTNKEFAALKSEIQDTGPQFGDEIIDGSRDACANDWLGGWGAPWADDEDEEAA